MSVLHSVPVKKALFIVFALVAVVLGIVIAHNQPSADQVAAVYRQALMTVIGGTMDPLLQMQHGRRRYDAVLARKHAGDLAVLGGMIPEAFARDTHAARDVDSTALPSVWSQHQDFLRDAQLLQSDAEALRSAVESGDQVQVARAIGTLDGACARCHRAFRAQ